MAAEKENNKKEYFVAPLIQSEHNGMWINQLKYSNIIKIPNTADLVGSAKIVCKNFARDWSKLFYEEVVEEFQEKKISDATALFAAADFAVKTILTDRDPNAAHNLNLFCLAIGMYYRGDIIGNLGAPKPNKIGMPKTIEWLSEMKETDNVTLINWANTAK